MNLGGFLLLAVVAALPTSGQNGKIAYTSDRDGNPEIYVMNADGSNQTRLTNGQAGDSDPAFSPDGTKIAFTSDRHASGNKEIYVMNADGSNQTRLTNSPGNNHCPAWSPDGERIAYINEYKMINVINSDGSRQKTIFQSTAPYPDLLSLDWSPDGAKIAFDQDIDPYGSFEDIFTMNTDGSDVIPITSAGDLEWFDFPAWSPDGSTIALTYSAGLDFFPYFQSVNGLDLIKLGYGRQRLLNGRRSRPDWAPDGTKIVFDDSFTSAGDIFVAGLDGLMAPVNLTNSSANDFDPSWGVLPAASLSVAGRVTTTADVGLRNATVSITDSAGIILSVMTSSLGFYAFDNVHPGEEYTISVSSKRYRFASRILQINASLTNVDFVGLE
jgi:Tol biopolymer transport system component